MVIVNLKRRGKGMCPIRHRIKCNGWSELIKKEENIV